MMVLGFLWRVLIGVLATGVTLRYGVGLFAWRAANRLEKPDYEVIEKLGRRMEVRAYGPYVIAEASIKTPSMTKGGGLGFRACAAYLFGKENRDRSSREARPMAMTAPVRMVDDANTIKVSFVMAKNESLKTLPVPTNSTVQLKQIPAHTAAFVTFNGKRPSDALVATKRQILDTSLKRSGRFRPQRNAPTLVYGFVFFFFYFLRSSSFVAATTIPSSRHPSYAKMKSASTSNPTNNPEKQILCPSFHHPL